MSENLRLTGITRKSLPKKAETGKKIIMTNIEHLNALIARDAQIGGGDNSGGQIGTSTCHR